MAGETGIGLSEVGDINGPINRQESAWGVEKVVYHGVDIKFLAMEHRNIVSPGFPEFSWYRPQKWKEIIKETVDSASLVFVEYFVPELEQTAFREPLVGQLIKKWAKDEGVMEFFDEVAKVASSRNIPIAVADPATSSLYALRELGIDQKHWKEKMSHRVDNDRVGYSGDSTLNIDPIELVIPRAIDARRLETARAIMQEVLDNNVGSVGSREFVYIGPTAHVMRIKEYILRQIGSETNPASRVNTSADLTVTGKGADIRKSKIYKKQWGLNTNIRYYHFNKKGWLKSKEVTIV